MSTFSRRGFLGMGAAVLAASALGSRALAAPTKAPGAVAKSGKRRVLVVLLQRGAVDGLSMVVPYVDTSYYSLRPSIAIAKPGDGPDAALKLDNTFALHPALSGLLPAWRDGHLAVVHGVGPADETRSHFDAQDYLESGTPGVKATADGWLNRALGLREAAGARAIALAPSSPRILGGPTDTLSFASIDDFKVTGARGFGAGAKTFEEMYSGAVDQVMHTTGRRPFPSSHASDKSKPTAIPSRTVRAIRSRRSERACDRSPSSFKPIWASMLSSPTAVAGIRTFPKAERRGS